MYARSFGPTRRNDGAHGRHSALFIFFRIISWRMSYQVPMNELAVTVALIGADPEEHFVYLAPYAEPLDGPFAGQLRKLSGSTQAAWRTRSHRRPTARRSRPPTRSGHPSRCTSRPAPTPDRR